MPGRAGALAEYVVMPAGNLVRLPRSVSFDEAAALEPMSIGLHAVRLVNQPVSAAAVVGAGPIGLSVLAALRLRRSRVTVFDFLPVRLRAAKRMGARRVIRVTPASPMAVNAARAGRKFGFVFEAGGTRSAVDLALELAAPGGTVALIGIHEEDSTPVNLHTARRKELILINVRRSNGELGECVRLVAAGRIDLTPMITHRAGLGGAARAFRMVERYRNGAIKAIINP
jgi:L-iditol 2-dehydrogenase